MKNLLKRPLVAVGIAIVGIGLIITGGSKMNQLKSVASTVTKTETAKAAVVVSDPFPSPDPIPASELCNGIYSDMGTTAKSVVQRTPGTYNTTWSINKWFVVLGEGISSGGNQALGNGIIGASSWNVAGAINSSGTVNCFKENWQVERFQSTGSRGLPRGNGTYIIRRDAGISSVAFHLQPGSDGRMGGVGGTGSANAQCPYLAGPFMSQSGYSPLVADTAADKLGEIQSSASNALCEYAPEDTSNVNSDPTLFSGGYGTDNGRNLWGYYSATTREDHGVNVTYIPTEWRVTGQMTSN